MATPVAMADVSPAWMMPKATWEKRRGILAKA
jgi:hypothetical protein